MLINCNYKLLANFIVISKNIYLGSRFNFTMLRCDLTRTQRPPVIDYILLSYVFKIIGSVAKTKGVDGNIWVVCFKKVVHAKKLSFSHNNYIILFPKKKINIYVINGA